MIPSAGAEGETVIQLGELVMILDLHRQGLSVWAIARRVGIDRKTVRKYIERGLEPPSYGPRKPRARRLEPFEAYLQQRVATYPGLTASRLLREIREHGYAGGYTAVTEAIRRGWRARRTDDQPSEIHRGMLSCRTAGVELTP